MKKILFCFIVLFSPICFAQTISGTVTDSITQTKIANAKILVSNLNSGYTDSTFTNSLGNWSYDFSTTSIGNNNYYPVEYLIARNYPNFFNPSTTIEFNLPKSGNVQILIHNLLGQLIDSREEFLN